MSILDELGLSEHRQFGNIWLHSHASSDRQMLSGGQIQMIGILRALLRNSPVLILDEATSALEEKIEIKMLKKIKEIYSERILILVSHRPEIWTLGDCRKVLSDGAIK